MYKEASRFTSLLQFDLQTAVRDFSVYKFTSILTGVIGMLTVYKYTPTINDAYACRCCSYRFWF